MKNCSKIAISVAFIFNINAIGIINASPILEQQDMQKMDNISHSLQHILAYTFESNQPQSIQKNSNQILTELNNIYINYNEIQSHIANVPVTFKLSAQVFAQQLSHAKEAIKNKNWTHAGALLQAIPAACITCHQQHAYNTRNLITIDNIKNISDYDLANIYYLIHNYDAALVNYDKFFLKSYQNNSFAYTLQMALERQIIIYIQKHNNIPAAAELLEKYKNLAKLPERFYMEINEWLDGLGLLQKTNLLSQDHYSFDDIQQQIKVYFDTKETLPIGALIPRSDQMFYLALSRIMYNYLYSNAQQNEIPMLLYWLSLCDRAMEYGGISLADFYLKECMLRDPNNPYAMRCYQEYKDYIDLSYSGSRGTDVPIYLQQELKQLKEKLDNNLK